MKKDELTALGLTDEQIKGVQALNGKDIESHKKAQEAAEKERDDYKQLSQRSKVLDELVPYTEAIHLQDSLQALAKMPEAERNAAIDRVIEALKKKETEKEAEEELPRKKHKTEYN